MPSIERTTLEAFDLINIHNYKEEELTPEQAGCWNYVWSMVVDVGGEIPDGIRDLEHFRAGLGADWTDEEFWDIMSYEGYNVYDVEAELVDSDCDRIPYEEFKALLSS